MREQAVNATLTILMFVGGLAALGMFIVTILSALFTCLVSDNPPPSCRFPRKSDTNVRIGDEGI